jgi:hypothetical protein
MRRNGALVLRDTRDLSRGVKVPPEAVDPPQAWMRALTFREIVALEPGKYRYFLGQLRRARRGDLTRKVPSRRIRRDARDVAWSKAVRERDPWCRGKWGVFGASTRNDHSSEEGAHVVPRGYKRTRHLVENGIGLCRRCHGYLTDHPKEAEAFFIAELGQAAHDRLWAIARGEP